MNVTTAARLHLILLIVVAIGTYLFLWPGLRIVGVQFPRQSWILTHAMGWRGGWWLWLLAIFGWMYLLATLAWTYLPAHRAAAMVQSGLMIISAVLLIAGVTAWMGVLPVVMAQPDASALLLLVDAFALNFLGAGCLMGGVVTAWIGYDLWRQRVVSRPWTLFCIGAGLAAIPSPFLFPFPFHLLLTALCWWLWAFYLAVLPRPHSPFAEYPSR
ncbi:MAG: hypothetical protein R2932_23675 [Caldilineaceae bacterium]